MSKAKEYEIFQICVLELVDGKKPQVVVDVTTVLAVDDDDARNQAVFMVDPSKKSSRLEVRVVPFCS